ncbi:MAG: hypothetical protein JXB06_14200 [Spirochaetales bacterium]|nr:hypothetical protein [Spirochaetales bacterium]
MSIPMGRLAVSKTPLRAPFAGGLTDLKSYAHRFGGVTVSCTIDRYVYVAAKRNHEPCYNLRYLDVLERVSQAGQIRHDLIRESIKLTGMDGVPLEIAIMVDLYAACGLGSSGAVTVGILHALHALKGERIERYALLQEAAHVEVDILQGASGYHDPAICTLGGLRLIEYTSSGITSRPLQAGADMKRRFADSLMFFYSGVHNQSRPSLVALGNRMHTVYPHMHRIREIGYELERAFRDGDIQRAAAIIGEQQELKQKLPGNFVNDFVLDVTARVRSVGAFAQLPGGKISAFVIVCCPDGRKDEVRRVLSDLQEVEIGLVETGTQARIV